jgi:PhnB protein
MTQSQSIPEGYHGPIPYLCVRNAAEAIAFYTKALGAQEIMRIDDPEGRIGHAELQLAGGRVFLSDEYAEFGVKSPAAYGGSPVTIHIYVEDVDAVAARFMAAGGKVLRPVEDQFYGDRGGKFEDPFGHVWWLASLKEVLTVDQIKQRAADVLEPAVLSSDHRR